MSDRVLHPGYIDENYEDIEYLRRMLVEIEQRTPRPVKFIEKLEKQIELLEDLFGIARARGGLDANIIRVTIPKIWLTKIHKLPALP